MGDVGEPGKYMGDVQAKLIADALAKGKFTGKDWDALPGKEIVCNPAPTKLLAAEPNRSYLIVPQPEDKWRPYDTNPWSTWKIGRLTCATAADPIIYANGTGFGMLLKYSEKVTVMGDISSGTAVSKGFVRVKNLRSCTDRVITTSNRSSHTTDPKT